MFTKFALVAAAAAILFSTASATFAAQGTSGRASAAKEAKCNWQANARNFGIHHYQRHRFVIRCIAGLSH
jgi:hypothetical protein